MPAYDAVIVGAGPNGLAAAITIARAGHRVAVVESREDIAGGTATEELTLAGFRHDVCAAVHPLGVGSPFLQSLPLADHGLRWVWPEVDLAHPLDDGSAAVLVRSIEDTAAGLGADADGYTRLMRPIAGRLDAINRNALRPLLRIPRNPLTMARFGHFGSRSINTLAQRFHTQRAKALIAGCGAHSIADLGQPFTSAVGLMLLAAGHVYGWPFARGGSSAITEAMARYLTRIGGDIITGTTVTDLSDLPEHRVAVLNMMPGAVAGIGGERISARRQKPLRKWRHGPGAFKIDLALSGPIPWLSEETRRSGTVHVGGTAAEIADAEAAVVAGRMPERPFVLVSQPTVADTSRAPEGHHVVWAYCHVPAGSNEDHSTAVEAQIERFAPGFTSLILGRSTRTAAAYGDYNRNYVGGDIAGGAFSTRALVARPRLAIDPYRLGKDIFMCSAATPPGAGVHGMCGYNAGRSVNRALAG